MDIMALVQNKNAAVRTAAAEAEARRLAAFQEVADRLATARATMQALRELVTPLVGLTLKDKYGQTDRLTLYVQPGGVPETNESTYRDMLAGKTYHGWAPQLEFWHEAHLASGRPPTGKTSLAGAYLSFASPTVVRVTRGGELAVWEPNPKKPGECHVTDDYCKDGLTPQTAAEWLALKLAPYLVLEVPPAAAQAVRNLDL